MEIDFDALFFVPGFSKGDMGGSCTLCTLLPYVAWAVAMVVTLQNHSGMHLSSLFKGLAESLCHIPFFSRVQYSGAATHIAQQGTMTRPHQLFTVPGKGAFGRPHPFWLDQQGRSLFSLDYPPSASVFVGCH